MEAARGAADILVCFENPHRILETLEIVRDGLQDPPVVVGREMTKVHEEFLRGRASEVMALLDDDKRRGEMVLAIQLSAGKGEEDDGEDPNHSR